MELDGRTIFHVDVNSAFLSWSALKILEEDPAQWICARSPRAWAAT